MKLIKTLIVITILLCFGPGTAAAKPQSEAQKLYHEANEKYYSEDFPEALNLYIEAMELAAKEHNDTTFIACTGYIANVYDTFNDANSSLFYYKKGYQAAKRIGKTRLETSFLTNIVTCYTRMGNVKEAKRYYALLCGMPEKDKDTNNRYYIYYVKARILAAERNYDQALQVHHEALRFAEANKMKPIYRLFQLSEIGNIYVRSGKTRQAVAMGDTCMAMAKAIGSRELLVNAYKMLADAYSQLQMPDSARRYREMYFDLNDSVYNIKKFYNARYKLSEYENKEHQHQVSQLNERITLQVYATAAVALFLGLVLLFSYIIYKKNRNLSRTQKLLIDKNRDLEAREHQNRMLLQQYLEQLKKNDAHDEASPKDAPATNDNDQEKQLLSLINDVMSDISVISNPDFSLQMLAEIVGSNTSYVSRVINNSYQKSFKTLLNERRIREACHKLANHKKYAGYTMQVIYEEVGYKNASSFIRAFKKIYNMTPSEFQRLTNEE